MMNKEKEIDLNDDEEDENLRDVTYSTKSEFSKAMIVELAMKKVIEARSKEMKEGYFNYVPLKNGDVKKVYIPDSRKEFIGSVIALKCVLKPEIRTSKKTNEFVQRVKEKEKEYFKKYSVNRSFVEGEDVITLKEKYLPEVDDFFPTSVKKYNQEGELLRKDIQVIVGRWNYNVRQYWNKMVLLYDSLFSELNSLIAEKEYFKAKSGY